MNEKLKKFVDVKNLCVDSFLAGLAPLKLREGDASRLTKAVRLWWK